jgi:hypothetical protein
MGTVPHFRESGLPNGLLLWRSVGLQKILNDCCCAVTTMLRKADLKLVVSSSSSIQITGSGNPDRYRLRIVGTVRECVRLLFVSLHR